MKRYVILFILFLAHAVLPQTTALWLFDEQVGIYPSCVLSDASDNDYVMVIGPGGQIVPGKYGNALEPIEQPKFDYPENEVRFGLKQLPIPQGRTVEPMSWMNANFCALMTSGENHLRKEVGFPNATKTKLNLGHFDWTVEFWFLPTKELKNEGIVFEIGQGPRGENDHVTRLLLNKQGDGFTLFNQPSGTILRIPSNKQALSSEHAEWHHLAFVYSSKENQLRHYVDGKRQPLPAKCNLQSLPIGDEAYFTVGRDGLWQRPLSGKIDELRFSAAQVYRKSFLPPTSFSPLKDLPRVPNLIAGSPLLFAKKNKNIDLGSRKQLFVDDALVEKMENISFNVNPPRLAECVISNIQGPYRKHLTVVEDEDGLIRIYNSVNNDYLQVMTSRDGIHFEAPDVGRGLIKGKSNIVIPQSVGGLGTPFIDANGAAEEKWKYVSGYHRRGIFLFTSADGYSWKRYKTAILPFRSGTQSCTFYDDQRQTYVSYHRTGIVRTPGGATQRESVLTQNRDIRRPWPFRPATLQDYQKAEKTMRLRQPLPWYLDNGPLTPGGFGIEYPHKFAPIDSLDPVGTDIYITKAIKYPWAPDTYLAFPIVYFHYEADGPKTRQILMDPARKRGSGPIETQISVSRDGMHWKRYPRPAYVGIGRHAGNDIHQAYMAHGMVKRGNEIWQYYFGETRYHSSWLKEGYDRSVYRVVQRLDGFVSADAPYDKIGTLITKPLRFRGNRLVLNIDTEATGYAQVGFVDENGKPVDGFSVDDCIYINGDFIDTEVEWIDKGKDVSSLAGRTLQIVFRMRGCKLYAMQFVEK